MAGADAWRNHVHSCFDAFGFAFDSMIAVRIALVNVKSVDDGGCVDKCGRVIGGFVHFEADGSDVHGGFGLVHFIGGLEHRRILGDVSCAEVVGIAADNGDWFVDENPPAGGLSMVIALCNVNYITWGGLFQGAPDRLQRGVFGGTCIFLFSDIGGYIPFRAEGGHGKGEADENGQHFFHVLLLFG